MSNNLTDVEQHIRRYWYADGFGELVGGGGMCLILALYFAAQEYLGDDTLIGGLLQASLALVLLGGFYLVRRLINAAKLKVTYPRTGYVEYQTGGGNRWVAGILSAVVAMALAATFVFIVRRINTIDAMTAISGAAVGIILFVKQVWSAKVKRFYILSLAALIFGAMLSVSGIPRGYNLGLFYGLMSLSFAISGGLTLKKYLSENPLPTEA